MGAVVAVVILVAVMLMGKWFLDNDDDHDEWRGW